MASLNIHSTSIPWSSSLEYVVLIEPNIFYYFFGTQFSDSNFIFPLLYYFFSFSILSFVIIVLVMRARPSRILDPNPRLVDGRNFTISWNLLISNSIPWDNWDTIDSISDN